MDHLGEYEIPEPRGRSAYDYATASLRVEDGFLVMHINGHLGLGECYQARGEEILTLDVR